MQQKLVHFIGIGGIGTSALARWFLSHGYKVSGSDASSSEITSDLRKQGIKVFIGHKLKNVPKGANLAIFSAAVPSNNPEIKQAKKLGIITKSYSEALGDLTKQYKTLAVAGAHGKSTTAALLSLVLIKAGFDPTVIIGTKLREFNSAGRFRTAEARCSGAKVIRMGAFGLPKPKAKARFSGANFRKGKSQYLVLEADEYHQSFLNYSPVAAIITNIDREHLDYYKNLRNIKSAFLKFIENIQAGGILVINRDDKNLFSLKDKIQRITRKKKVKIIWYSITNFADRQSLLYLRKILKIAGEHNISNALAVYTLAKALGIKDKDVFEAIGRYRGAWRRMEYKGKFQIPNSKFQIDVYDDYAHHPTEIKATLTGIAQKWPKTALICVFQPHQAKRLSLLFREFTGAFDRADALVLLPVYQVRGRDNLSHNMDCCNAKNSVAKSLSKELAKAIKKHIGLKPKTSNLKTVVYLPSPKKLPKILEGIVKNISVNQRSNPRQSAIIVMMGAGDIYKYTNNLI